MTDQDFVVSIIENPSIAGLLVWSDWREEQGQPTEILRHFARQDFRRGVKINRALYPWEKHRITCARKAKGDVFAVEQQCIQFTCPYDRHGFCYYIYLLEGNRVILREPGTREREDSTIVEMVKLFPTDSLVHLALLYCGLHDLFAKTEFDRWSSVYYFGRGAKFDNHILWSNLKVGDEFYLFHDRGWGSADDPRPPKQYVKVSQWDYKLVDGPSHHSTVSNQNLCLHGCKELKPLIVKKKVAAVK